jgi:hypothetical protein
MTRGVFVTVASAADPARPVALFRIRAGDLGEIARKRPLINAYRGFGVGVVLEFESETDARRFRLQQAKAVTRSMQ